MKKTVYIVGYADGECSHIIEIFSTRLAAEKYLKPYEDLKTKYGNEDEVLVSGFYPDIREVVVDAPEELIFIRVIERFENSYENEIEFYGSYFGIESSKDIYRTFTLDADNALEEAIEFFKNVDNI
jgi:hypothetical protein